MCSIAVETMPCEGRDVIRLNPTKSVRIAVGNDITSWLIEYSDLISSRCPKEAAPPRPIAARLRATANVQLVPRGASTQIDATPRQTNTVAVPAAMTTTFCSGYGSPNHSECPEDIAMRRRLPTVAEKTAKLNASRCGHFPMREEMNTAQDSTMNVAAVCG
jgi:hypothetical protein